MIQFIKLAAASNEVVTSWFDLIMKGGIIMIPILLLSIVSIYIFVERYVYLKKATARDNKLLDSILRKCLMVISIKP
jgi:biopolymer transport protein ExbB